MRIFAITSVPVAAKGNVTRKYYKMYAEGTTEEIKQRLNFFFRRYYYSIEMEFLI